MSTSLLLVSASVVALLNKPIRIRRFAKHPLNQNRKIVGHYESIVRYMLNAECDVFFKYTRMTPYVFKNLLQIVESVIKKDVTKHPIEPTQRLIMTLGYLR